MTHQETDPDSRLLLLDFAISQSTKRLGRDPNAQEILDFLFAGRRDSPNTQRMEHEMKRLMKFLQGEAKVRRGHAKSEGAGGREGESEGNASGAKKCRGDN